MWKPRIDFLALHCTCFDFYTIFPASNSFLADAWIITLSVLSLVIIYPYGNLKAIDAYFFGASASTESGLNT